MLQEGDTQKILLKTQIFMKCVLEVRAAAWQSRELPYFPALLHVFPAVSKPPWAWLYSYCSGDGFVLVEQCIWAVLRNRYQFQAEEKLTLTLNVTAAVCTMTKGHITRCCWDMSELSWSHPHLPHSVLPQETSISHVILLWAAGTKRLALAAFFFSARHWPGI